MLRPFVASGGICPRSRHKSRGQEVGGGFVQYRKVAIGCEGAGFSDDIRDRVVTGAKRPGYVPNNLAAAFCADQAGAQVSMCEPEQEVTVLPSRLVPGEAR